MREKGLTGMCNAENQRKVLREVHSQAGKQPVVGREPVPDELHAEVHGGVERGVGGVYYEDQVGSGAIEKCFLLLFTRLGAAAGKS